MSASSPSRSLPRRVLGHYVAGDAGHWATIVAWNALFSFVPIVLALATFTAILLSNSNFETYLAREVAAVVHKTPAAVSADFTSFRQRSGLLALFSLASMVWGGSALFSAIDNALSRLSGTRPRRFWAQKRMAAGMIVLFILLVIPILVSSSALSVQPSHLPSHGLPRFVTQSTAGARILVFIAQIAVGTVSGAVLFGVIYRVVPARRRTVRAILPGAAFAGVAFESVTLLFPLYFRATQGNGATAALLALPFLLTFFFALGQITVVGELLNLEIATRKVRSS